MDIWSWVFTARDELREQGQDRLADILLELPQLVCNDEHEQAELLAPEGIALAQALDLPWIEVFLGHWLAQSRVLHRHDITHGMEYVIRLLDFAHTPRTQDCPQSVCVTQDVCAAYSHLDGPGYATERLTASRETLQRINPSWPCFTCISGEHASALLDAGRYADAEEFCRSQLRALAASGEEPDWDLLSYCAKALAAQGRHAEALKLLRPPPKNSQPSKHREYKLQRARELALLGQGDKARRMFETVRGIEPPDYVVWARCVRALCQCGAIVNDAALSATLRTFVQTLRANGALYDSAWLLLVGAQLALMRHDREAAAACLDEAGLIIPKLLAPQKLIDKQRRLREQIGESATR